MKTFDVSNIVNFALKTNLLILKPMQDNTVGIIGFDEYKKVNAEYVELDGDHHFSKPEDRKVILEKIKEFFESDK